jgi:formylglycine-generating enzyme required for sulfatase activity
LTFWPEAGFVGHAGSLRYSVDNGHGGVADGATDVDVGAAVPATGGGATDASVEAALWDGLQGSNDPQEIAAFLRLFPNSGHAEEARRLQMALADAREKNRAVSDNAGQPDNDPPAKNHAIVAMVNPQTSLTDPPPPGASPTVPMLALSGKPVVVPQASPQPPPAGNVFQDCPTCPQMVRIPAGSFTMGQGAREPEAQPAHRVTAPAFALGLTPVTVEQWKACLAAKACQFMPRMRVADDQTPVHNLSWEDLSQYIAWISAQSGHTYRLPSEAEWEYAARGGTSTHYWWGDSAGVALANCSDCGGKQDAAGPMPVEAFKPNPFGLYDMLGGVAQWTADCWVPNYRGAPSDTQPRTTKDCEKRVLRGGSFRSAHDDVTVTARSNYDAPVRYLVNGFRVARDLN